MECRPSCQESSARVKDLRICQIVSYLSFAVRPFPVAHVNSPSGDHLLITDLMYSIKLKNLTHLQDINRLICFCLEITEFNVKLIMETIYGILDMLHFP